MVFDPGQIEALTEAKVDIILKKFGEEANIVDALYLYQSIDKKFRLRDSRPQAVLTLLEGVSKALLNHLKESRNMSKYSTYQLSSFVFEFHKLDQTKQSLDALI
jgi:hypothetical protein